MFRQAGAVALGLALAGSAGAADWRLAGESDRAVSYLDLASVAKTGTAARFSRWMVLRAPMSSGADNLKDSFEADCGTRAYKVLSAQAFKGEREAGGMTASAGTAEPGTITASLIDIACGGRKPDAATVADPYLAGKERLTPAPAR